MTDRARRSRPDFGELREAASGLRPWAVIRAAANPKLPLRAPDRAVFLALARHADPFGYCYPSLKRLAECSGLGQRRTWQAIRTLERVGLISVEGVNGRVNCYRLEATVIERYAAPEAKTETAARHAKVGEAANVGGNAPKPETLAQCAKVESTPIPVAAAEGATIANCARPLANSARPLANSARPVAHCANELAAFRTSFKEEGCADAHRAPTEQDREAAEALAEAERTLPQRCRPSIELAKIAYQRNPNLTLLKALLSRLEVEAVAGGTS